MTAPQERNRIDDLTAFARLMKDMDPELINAATRAERHRIAALIELQEGPGGSSDMKSKPLPSLEELQAFTAIE